MGFFHILAWYPAVYWVTFALAIVFFIVMLGTGQVPG
jgi:hypothetical protein